jgi:hypothetical protein
MTDSNQSENTGTRVNIKFVFNHCNDIHAVRRFYGELIGMRETAFHEEWGYLCYKTEGFEFMFFRSKTPIEVPAEFSSQPGYEGGPRKAVSWAIEVTEDLFPGIVSRLQDAGAKSWKPQPEWRQDSYWGYSVLDPMGNTVEIYSIPAEKPDEKEWPIG